MSAALPPSLRRADAEGKWVGVELVEDMERMKNKNALIAESGFGSREKAASQNAYASDESDLAVMERREICPGVIQDIHCSKTRWMRHSTHSLLAAFLVYTVSSLEHSSSIG